MARGIGRRFATAHDRASSAIGTLPVSPGVAPTERQADAMGSRSLLGYRPSTLRAGPSNRLPAGDRAFFESKFGADFSNVRIHRDPYAAGMAERLNARAFTHGSDIHFGRGFYSPGTAEGRRLIAHELGHVVQQRAGGARAIQRKELHFYDPSDNFLRLKGYAAHYCANYDWLNKQCRKRKPGKLHSAAYTISNVIQRARLFKSHGHKIHEVIFHTHGGPGYINLARQSISSANAARLAGMSQYLEPKTRVDFLGCNVGEGKKGARFLSNVAWYMLHLRGGKVCASDSITFSVPWLGQRGPLWTKVKCHSYAGGRLIP